MLLPLKRKNRTGMYPEQFHLLQEGDVVRGVKSRTPRMILRVCKDRENGIQTTGIYLLKLRRSWTTGPNTLYCTSDAHMFVPIKVKNSRIWDYTYEKVQGRRVAAYVKRNRLLIVKAKERLAMLENSV